MHDFLCHGKPEMPSIGYSLHIWRYEVRNPPELASSMIEGSMIELNCSDFFSRSPAGLFFLANFKDRQNTGTEKFPLFDRNVGISLFVERPRCPCPRPSQLCDKAQMCHAECGTPGLWWSHGLEQSDQCHWVHQLWHLQYWRNCAKGTGHGHCHEQGVTVVCVSWSFPFHSTIGESWFYIIL